MNAVEAKQNILAELLHDQTQQQQAQASLEAQHKTAVLSSDTEQAEQLEADIDAAKRKQTRLSIQIEAARSALADAEAADRKSKAAKATKEADAIADRAVAKLNALEPLAAQLEEIVGALSNDYNEWFIARSNAKHLGGLPKPCHGGPQASALFESIVGNGKKLARVMGAFSNISAR